MPAADNTHGEAVGATRDVGVPIGWKTFATAPKIWNESRPCSARSLLSPGTCSWVTEVGTVGIREVHALAAIEVDAEDAADTRNISRSPVGAESAGSEDTEATVDAGTLAEEDGSKCGDGIGLK